MLKNHIKYLHFQWYTHVQTNQTTCEKDLKVESEGVDDTYTHRDVRKTIDNDTDTSLVTIDYKLSVERNEPIGFVNGSDVIPRKCTGILSCD